MTTIIVLNNQPRVIHCGGFVSLTPGTNEVDADSWESAAKIAVVASLVDSGQIEPKMVSDIKNLKPEEAKRVIKDTFKPDLLTRWRAGESRRGIVDAIDAQLTTVNDAIAEAAKADANPKS